MVNNSTIYGRYQYTEFDALVVCTIFLPIFTIFGIYLYVDFKDKLCVFELFVNIKKIIYLFKYCFSNCFGYIDKIERKKKLNNIVTIENGVFDMNTTCSICLDNTDINNIILECRHTFHKKCINDWVNQCINNYITPQCPICRDIILNTEQIKNFKVHNSLTNN